LSRLIVLLLILALFFYLNALFRRLDEPQRKKLIKRLAILGLLGGLVVLVLSGRIHFLFAAIGALLPMIPRLARFLIGAWPTIMPYFKRYQQNSLSSMQSRFIRLQINVITGELQGEVLEGEYKGQTLKMLSPEALLLLLDECGQHDAQSAALLIAYLDANQPGWSNSKTEGNADAFRQPESDSIMSVQQARNILGVPENANKKEVTAAHKRLMQKMHPDRGGSEYLAQQINRARDILLKK